MSRVRSPYWPYFSIFIGDIRRLDLVTLCVALTPSWWITRGFSIQIKFEIFTFEIVFWTYWIEKSNIVIKINKFFAQVSYFVQMTLFRHFKGWSIFDSDEFYFRWLENGLIQIGNSGYIPLISNHLNWKLSQFLKYLERKSFDSYHVIPWLISLTFSFF